MQVETAAALRFLGVQDQTFMVSIQTHMQNPATRVLLEQAELKARQEFEPVECSLGKTELKAIFLELTRLEQEASYKLLGQTGLTQQQVQSAALVEKTKVYDQIYLKHGIKFAALMAGVEKYALR
jgi:hypothetical protein